MLKLTSIKKTYQDFILDCSLEIQEGCITGLIGENGAGKSTTFKAILGLISIEDGNIELFDDVHQVLTTQDKQKLGVVLSDSGFSEYLSILDIIPVLDNVYKEFQKDWFMKKCQSFQLPMNKKIKDFSSGMKARLKILIALSHQAQFLILDEPTSGLDVLAREEILELLREYMAEDERRSILISSHISSDLENLCDDIYLIHQGHIVFHEDTDVLLSDYALLKVSEEQYMDLDKNYLLKIKRENYGYLCLTNQKQYYVENYPHIVIEKGNIDELMLMMLRGEDK